MTHVRPHLHVVHAACSHQSMIFLVSIHLMAYAPEQTISVTLHRHHLQALVLQGAAVMLETAV